MSLGESIMVFGDWFQIKFIENDGAAYGLELGGEGGKLVLSLVRIVLISLLFYWIVKLIKNNEKTGVLIGISLVLCGAVGNMIDSIFYGIMFSESTYWEVANFVSYGEGYSSWLHGSVVDMLYFPIINIESMPEWIPFFGGKQYTFFSPIFNLADSYITCGAFYLLLFHRKDFLKKL